MKLRSTFEQKFLFAAIFFLFICAAFDANAQAIRWAQKGGSTTSDEGWGVATDKWGYVYATGSYTGSATFSGSTLTSKGNSDAFLVKYNLAGQMQWLKSIGGGGQDIGRRVTTDKFGNVYLCGFFENSLTEGGSTLTSAGKLDVFIAKYNTNGDFQWIRQISSVESDSVCSIAADSLGNVYATGPFAGNAKVLTKDMANIGKLDIYIAKISPDGNLLWGEQGGGSENAPSVNSRDISVDRDGNVYIMGNYNGKISVGGRFLDDLGGIFIAKWNTNGASQWAYSSEAYDPLPLLPSGRGMAVSALGDVYVALGTRYITLGGVKYSNTIGDGDGWLVKFGTDGKYQWHKRFETSTFAVAGAVAADTSGAYVTGTTVGGISAPFGITTVGLSDAFAAKFDRDGKLKWSHRFGGAYIDSAFGMAMDPLGNAYAVGYFEGTTSFGSSSPISMKTAGNKDYYLVKIANNDARPLMVLTESNIDFGNVSQNKTKDSTFEIRSKGIHPLTVYSMKIIGANSGAFKISNMPELPMIIDTSLKYKVFLRYTSTTTPSFGRIEIVSNNGNKLDTSYIELKGLKSGMTFTGNPFDLGTIDAKKVKTEKFYIRNSGDYPLLIRNVILSNPANAPFKISEAPSAKTVAPGDSVSLDITFSPLLAGNYTAKLRIASDVNAGEDTTDVEIKGTASPENSVEYNTEESAQYLSLTANPNVVSENTSVILNVRGNSSQNIVVKIVDNLGREISIINSGNFAPDTYKFEFSAAQLPSGAYHLIAISEKAAVRIPLVIKK